ncbi:MAG: hypothetical protein H6583_03465 [Alteromonas sp.]|nr:hypothetical protein [Alteromonas sp.]
MAWNSLFQTKQGVWSVAAGDLDGDLDPDVVSANNFEDTLTWFENLNGLEVLGAKHWWEILVLKSQSMFLLETWMEILTWM